MLASCYLLMLGLAASDTDRIVVIDPPSMALLEFLGSFEDAEGHWVDPLSLPEDLDQEPISDRPLDDRIQQPQHHDKPKQDEPKDHTTDVDRAD